MKIIYLLLMLAIPVCSVNAASAKARCQSGFDFIYSILVLNTDLEKTVKNSIAEARDYGYFENSDHEIREYLISSLETIKKDKHAVEAIKESPYFSEKAYINSCLGNPPR